MVPRQLTGGLRPRDALLEFALSLCLLLPFLVQASLAQNVSIPSGQNGSDVVKSPINSVDDTEDIDFGQVFRDVVAAGLSKVPRSLVRRLLTADVRFECSTSFLRTMRAFQNHEPWALRHCGNRCVPQSWMRRESTPRVRWKSPASTWGAYDECLATAVRDRTGNVLSRGQYCNLLVYAKNAAAMQAIVNTSLEVPAPNAGMLNLLNGITEWENMLVSAAFNSVDTFFFLRMCIPLFFVIMWFYLLPRIVDGPDTETFFQRFYAEMSEHWWHLLVQIRNFYRTKVQGPVNRFLSWNAFVPLSKLSYGVYLIHLPLFKLMMHSSRERVYFSEFYQVTLYFGVLTWCLVFSYFAYIACEAPTAALDKVIFGRLTRGAGARSQQRQEQQLESGDLNTLSDGLEGKESSPR
ncbi:hypothetical protein MTO96_019740 [Rhipicephalus appendiculatus]